MYDTKLFSAPAPICFVCNQPVRLDYAKTDEDGNAIHEDCYLIKLGVKLVVSPLQGPSEFLLKVKSPTGAKLRLRPGSRWLSLPLRRRSVPSSPHTVFPVFQRHWTHSTVPF